MKLTAFGTVDNPFNTIGGPAALTGSADGSGLISILTALLRTTVVIAGLYVLFNIIIAGYTFLGAGGDPKKVQQAWEKIYLSLLGLLVVAGSLVLAALFGFIIYGNATILIAPRIFAPQ